MGSLELSLHQNPLAVTSIDVTGLFGEYTYKLATVDHPSAGFSRLMILYGENGSGKTTILNLLYNLMSAADSRGHRTFLANTPFEKFAVSLVDETVISAERSDPVAGSYTMSIHRSGSRLLQAKIPTTPDNRVDSDHLSPNYPAFIAELAGLKVATYFLSDDRRLQSDLLPEEEDAESELHSYVLSTRVWEEREVWRRRQQSSTSAALLRTALDRITQLFRQHTLEASNVGDTNVTQIYTEIAKRIAISPGATGAEEFPGTRQLANTLNALAERNRRFAGYGLTPELAVDDLIAVLRKARPQTQSIMGSVLSPFIDGLKARLDALQDTLTKVTLLVDMINGFYNKQKQVRFDIGRGLTIVSRDGSALNPDLLSSGEKQLLLLFCYALLAREQPSIFLIDEPELSLNVKWQRQLTSALLELVEGSNVQFILATHSVELLTRHKEHVIQLLDKGYHR